MQGTQPDETPHAHFIAPAPAPGTDKTKRTPSVVQGQRRRVAEVPLQASRCCTVPQKHPRLPHSGAQAFCPGQHPPEVHAEASEVRQSGVPCVHMSPEEAVQNPERSNLTT